MKLFGILGLGFTLFLENFEQFFICGQLTPIEIDRNDEICANRADYDNCEVDARSYWKNIFVMDVKL